MWRGALLAPWLAAAAAFALEAAPLAAGAPLSPDPSSSVCAFSAAYPRSYVAYRADEPPDLDGRVTGDKAWDTVAWTDPFEDISTETQPRLLTRAKIRWDDQFLYVGARLQEPDVWANLTEHDSVIFRDNDFEIFVDADQSTAYYKEFEMNALGTDWDLCLNRPYDNGGHENSSRVLGARGFDMQPLGLASAARTDGAVNVPSVPASFWEAEARLPMSGLVCNTTAKMPSPGDLWRINMSRVEWKVTVRDGQYVKSPPTQAEDNWVWQKQGQIAMHIPERWGYVQFADSDVNGTEPIRDKDWPLRYMASALYDAQELFFTQHGRYATTQELPALAVLAPPHTLDGSCSSRVAIALAPDTGSGPEYAAEIVSAGGTRRACVANDRRRAVTAAPAVSVASCAPVERSPSTLAPRLRAMAAASARLPPLRCSRGLQAASARPLRLQARAARPDPSLALFQALGGAILKSGVEVASSALASAQKGAAEEARAAAAPRKPPGPQLDVSPQLIADPLTFIDDAQREHGDVVGLRLAGERCMLIGDPLAARQVLIERSGIDFVKEGTAFFPGSSLAGEGLLVSDGALWQRQRRLSTPAFRAAAVRRYSDAMLEATQDFLAEEWRCAGGAEGARGGAFTVASQQVRDVYGDFNVLTLDVVARALFGADLSAEGALIQSAVAEAFEHFATRAASGFVVPEWAPTPSNARYATAVAQLDRVVYGLIAKRRAAIAANGVEVAGDDLLGDLLCAVDDGDGGDGGGMGDKPLRDELMTLMVAGQETSAIVLAWACALLSERPHMQARIAAEVATAGGEAALCEAVEARALPYTEAVLYECMRLRPPAYMVGRCAARDAVVETRDGRSYDVPRGTTLLVAPWLLHRDGRFWGADAREFRPERWLGAQGEELRKSEHYLPFGAGPRGCIGARFALVEGMVVLGALCSRARLAPAPLAPRPTPGALITLRPEGAVLLAVSPRAKEAAGVGGNVAPAARADADEDETASDDGSWQASAGSATADAEVLYK